MADPGADVGRVLGAVVDGLRLARAEAGDVRTTELFLRRAMTTTTSNTAPDPRADATRRPPCPKCGRSEEGPGDCYDCRWFAEKTSRGLRLAGVEPLADAPLWKPSAHVATIRGLTVANSGRGYWVVGGPVPMAVARELYDDPAGRELIRVDGHCACPPPDEWATWIMPDGREVSPTEQRQDWDRLIGHTPTLARHLAGIHFSDDPAADGAAQFVTNYHIDGDLGLRVFADIVKARMT